MMSSILLVHTTLKGLSDGSHVYCVLLSYASASPGKHYLSFGCTVFCTSTGVLLNDKARDRSEVAIGLLVCCRTPRILKFYPATAINYLEFPESIAIRALMFTRIFAKLEDLSASNCCDSSLNLLIFCFWLKSLRNFSLC